MQKEEVREKFVQTRQEGKLRRQSRRLRYTCIPSLLHLCLFDIGRHLDRRQLEQVVAGTSVSGTVHEVTPQGLYLAVTSLGPLPVLGFLSHRDLPAQFQTPETLAPHHRRELLLQDFYLGREVTCGVLRVHPRPDASRDSNLQLLFESFAPPSAAVSASPSTASAVSSARTISPVDAFEVTDLFPEGVESEAQLRRLARARALQSTGTEAADDAEQDEEDDYDEDAYDEEEEDIGAFDVAAEDEDEDEDGDWSEGGAQAHLAEEAEREVDEAEFVRDVQDIFLELHAHYLEAQDPASAADSQQARKLVSGAEVFDWADVQDMIEEGAISADEVVALLTDCATVSNTASSKKSLFKRT